MTPPRRCPTNHRNVTEDGWRVEKSLDASGAMIRHAWVLSTCRDCGVRLEEAYKLKRTGGRRPVTVAERRDIA